MTNAHKSGWCIVGNHDACVIHVKGSENRCTCSCHK